MPLKLKVSWKAKGADAKQLAKNWMADPKHDLHDPQDMKLDDDDSSSGPDTKLPEGARVKEMKVKIKAEIPAKSRKRYHAVGEDF